ncbi:transposable element Tcb2 transposase [Trichonephila clavipes]|nr:transposable element Tcb2 transposase [Trichonephila clavipes]
MNSRKWLNRLNVNVVSSIGKSEAVTEKTDSSLQADHLIRKSAHAPQRPMVSYTEMDTEGLGLHEPGRVFSDESRFNLSSDNNRVRVRRQRGERLNPAFALQRQTAPTAGVIAYNTRSLLVLICGTMTAQRYVHDILQPHVLPLTQRGSQESFQQDNARPHTARVSQAYLRPGTTLPWPTPDPQI